MKIKQVFWTDKAIKSLRQISNFTENQWNQEVADYLLDLIDVRIELIKSNPHISQKIEKTEYYRILVHRHVSLFYEIQQNTLKVLLIWDNRQSPKLLAKLIS